MVNLWPSTRFLTMGNRGYLGCLVGFLMLPLIVNHITKNSVVIQRYFNASNIRDWIVLYKKSFFRVVTKSICYAKFTMRNTALHSFAPSLRKERSWFGKRRLHQVLKVYISKQDPLLHVFMYCFYRLFQGEYKLQFYNRSRYTSWHSIRVHQHRMWR